MASLRKHVEVVLACPSDRLEPKFAQEIAGGETFGYRPAETIFALLNKKNRLRLKIRACDLVHLNGHWRWENYFLSRICIREAIPYLVHPRGMLWKGHRKQLLKKIFNLLIGFSTVRRAAAVVALSEFEKKQWTAFGLTEKQQQVIPNGFTALSQGSASIVPGSSFLFVGRIESRKNLEFLVRGFSEYRAEGGNLSLELMGPEERGYGDQIRALARELGVASEVHFIPPTYGDEKWKRIRAARAVIYPTIEEAFGRVPFEAALVETVSVAPKESGSYEYLEPFFGPYFFPLSDRNAFVSILHGLDQFPPDPARMRQARQYVENSLSWHVVTAKFLRLYLSLRSLPESRMRQAS